MMKDSICFYKRLNNDSIPEELIEKSKLLIDIFNNNSLPPLEKFKQLYLMYNGIYHDSKHRFKQECFIYTPKEINQHVFDSFAKRTNTDFNKEGLGKLLNELSDPTLLRIHDDSQSSAYHKP